MYLPAGRSSQREGQVGQFAAGPRYAGAPDRIFIPNSYYIFSWLVRVFCNRGPPNSIDPGPLNPLPTGIYHPSPTVPQPRNPQHPSEDLRSCINLFCYFVFSLYFIHALMLTENCTQTKFVAANQSLPVSARGLISISCLTFFRGFLLGLT
jgi:hypothetical protein